MLGLVVELSTYILFHLHVKPKNSYTCLVLQNSTRLKYLYLSGNVSYYQFNIYQCSTAQNLIKKIDLRHQLLFMSNFEINISSIQNFLLNYLVRNLKN